MQATPHAQLSECAAPAGVNENLRPANENLPAATEYVRAIENCFVQIRGRGVQWSPDDAVRAHSWHAAGLPLGAALRVLAARVKAYRFTHGERARLPMTLAWYEPAILQQCKHLQRFGHELQLAAQADAQAAEPPEPGLSHLLDALPALLQAADNAVTERAYRQAFAVLDEALQAGEPPAQDDEAIDAVIEKCRARMLKTLQQGLDEAAAQRIETEVDAQLQPWRGQLSRKVLASRRSALVQRWLLAHHGASLPTRSGWTNVDD